MEKKLYRDEHRKVIGGVCAGLADYFNMDVSIVRLIFVAGGIAKGITLVPYIILWIVLPKRPFNLNGPNQPFNPGVDYTNFNPNFNQTYNNGKVDYSVPPPNAAHPFMPTPAKKSNVSLMFGVVLIVLGAIFLMDEFNWFPDFDFDKTWPVVLVAVGAVLIFTGQKKHDWEKHDWNSKTADFSKTDAASEATEEAKKDDDNQPTSL
ncbi:PspC domain-containing protein [Mucilaginibacter glaciei]|uniref:PspC domain-containing protein n=1 Tax=Mucilaginibacter glaciei TaxID=2772109 RepID=A0A926NRT5_9SPHI|nr:PspC domain-containing protein [Mucilaginibacter glaciei]MBD1392745.1 PspC domain-containing protein [Mucilaginibacter glaciei]